MSTKPVAVSWLLALPTGALLLPARSSCRRWPAAAAAQRAINKHKTLHVRQLPLRHSLQAAHPPPPIAETQRRQCSIGWAIVLWLAELIGLTRVIMENYEEQMPGNCYFDGVAYSMSDFVQVRCWRQIHPYGRATRMMGEHSGVFASVDSAAEPMVEIIPAMQCGAPKVKPTKKRPSRQAASQPKAKPPSAPQQPVNDDQRRKQKRRILRDRLNSSDDVIGCEEISETESSEEIPSPALRMMSAGDERRAERLQELAYRFEASPSPPAASSSGPTRNEERRARPVPRPSGTSPIWTRAGSRWRMTIRTRGMPAHLPEISIRVEQDQLPLSPSMVDFLIFDQHPEMRQICERVSLVRFHEGSFGTPVAHLHPLRARGLLQPGQPHP